jgi:hypothetical protein
MCPCFFLWDKRDCGFFSASLTRDIYVQIVAIGRNPGKWSIVALAILNRLAGKAINLKAFTNRHFRDRGQILAGNEGDEMDYKLKIPQCPWGILSLSGRE